MELTDIKAAAQRLSRTPTGYQAGYAAGTAWAKHEADAVELEGLEVWQFSDELEQGNRGGASNPARLIAEARFEQEWGYPSAEDVLGGPITEQRLRGFVDGALQTWWAVRPHLVESLASEGANERLAA